MDQYIKDESLRLLAERLANYTYPGYPEQKDRLILGWLDKVYDAQGRLDLPDGPWTIRDSADKKDAGLLPTERQQEAFLQKGIQLDSLGRPLHPWTEEMLKNPQVGGVLNRGFYYNWGPNYTADTVVISESDNTLLLIRRKDTGQWALPGGFIDGDERADTAARREVSEETGVVLPNDAELQLTYAGPVGDPRSTLHAWAETSCFIARVANQLPCKGADDALEAAWVPVETALQQNVFGSHRILIQDALSRITHAS
jgi:ADP-ribose pyrophosphatase